MGVAWGRRFFNGIGVPGSVLFWMAPIEANPDQPKLNGIGEWNLVRPKAM
jgi:hypothetical protein